MTVTELHKHDPARVRLYVPDGSEIPGRWYRCRSCGDTLYEVSKDGKVAYVSGTIAVGVFCGCSRAARCADHVCPWCQVGGNGPLCDYHRQEADDFARAEAIDDHPAGRDL